jgi:hypothetical protein
MVSGGGVTVEGPVPVLDGVIEVPARVLDGVIEELIRVFDGVIDGVLVLSNAVGMVSRVNGN